jgi:hypothetical protein
LSIAADLPVSPPAPVRLFMDSEFTGLHQFSTLISLAFSSESGVEFYAEFTDFDRAQCDDWLRENVLAHTRWLAEGVAEPLEQNEAGLSLCLGDAGFVTARLVAWLARFPAIEVWADCPAWDWVLFCQLFGGALHLPRQISYLPRDLATLFQCRGWCADTPRAAFAGFAPDGTTGQPHNALWDARVLRACHARLAPGLPTTAGGAVPPA